MYNILYTLLYNVYTLYIRISVRMMKYLRNSERSKMKQKKYSNPWYQVY